MFERLKEIEPVEVKVVYSDIGHEGPGWYVWEVDAEDEGYTLFSITKPIAEDLKAVCTEYVEV